MNCRILIVLIQVRGLLKEDYSRFRGFLPFLEGLVVYGMRTCHQFEYGRNSVGHFSLVVSSVITVLGGTLRLVSLSVG